MAIDPSISLGVRVPQFNFQLPSPIEQQGRLMTLRGLMDQQQLRQMQIEQTQIEKQALQDKRRRATESSNLFSTGRRPTEEQILSVGGTDAGALIKALHDSDKSKFDALDASTKAIARAAQGVKALPAEQRDFGYRAQRAQ